MRTEVLDQEAVTRVKRGTDATRETTSCIAGPLHVINMICVRE